MVLEVTGYLVIAVLAAIPTFHYTTLPELVPDHYGLKGEVNTYRDKSSLFTFAIKGIIIFTVLSIASHYPHKFNYISKITPDNALKKYTAARRGLSILKVILAFAWCYITYSMANISELGSFFIPMISILSGLFIVCLFLFIKE